MTSILVPSTSSVDLASEVDPRIDAVRRYRVLDTPSDGDAAKIVRLAADLFGVPIAVVSLVDEDRIWLRSCFGLEGIESLPLDPGLCVTAILSADVYVVPSARDDPRALANPLVAGDMGLQFYAAAPLITHDGHRLGNLAILDLQPRDLSEHDRSLLRQLASLYMDELEMRLEARRVVAREREQRAEAERQRTAASNLARTLQTSLLPPRLPRVTGLDLAVEFEPAAADVVGGDFYDVFSARHRSVVPVAG